MHVRMKTALVGPTTNYQAGDIVETNEAARWIEFGIAEPVGVAPVTAPETIETAFQPIARETATRRRSKAPK